jgi:hypothetical protein
MTATFWLSCKLIPTFLKADQERHLIVFIFLPNQVWSTGITFVAIQLQNPVYHNGHAGFVLSSGCGLVNLVTPAQPMFVDVCADLFFCHYLLTI